MILIEWYFPKNPRDTQEFYFPSQSSMIIFEIRDLEGTEHLVIFRGNGLANQKRYSRWIISGHYEKSMFVESLDTTSIRPRFWEDIVAYASRQHRVVNEYSASELKKQLRKNPRWLPTKEGLQQRNFTTVLKTLNTLGDVRDKTLKQVLLDLNDDLETSMDFAKEYGHVWSDFQERRGAHVRIEEDLSIIKKTKSVFAEEIVLNEKIVQSLKELGPEIESLYSDTEARRISIQEEINSVEDSKKSVDQNFELVGKNLSTKLSQIGAEKRTIEQLSIEENWAKANDIDSLTSHAELQEEMLHDIKTRLNDAKLDEYENSRSIETSISNLEKEVKEYKSILEGSKNTLYSKLHDLKFSQDPWKFLNPKLLLKPGSLSDKSMAKSLLENISGSIQNGTIDYNGLIIHDLHTLEGAPSLDDPEEITKILRIKNKKLDSQKQRLKDILDYENVKKQFEITRNASKKADQELARMGIWLNEGSVKLNSTKDILSNLDQEVTLLKEEQSVVNKEIKRLQRVLKDLRTKKDNLLTETNDIIALWTELQADYIPNIAFQKLSDSNTLDLFARLKQVDVDSKAHGRVSRKLSELREELLPLQLLIGNPTRNEFLPMLFIRAENLSLEKENLDKEWQHLVTNMSSKASNLKQSLNALNNEINEINRRFRKINVSNLDDFSVEFNEHSTDISLIEDIAGLTQLSAWDSSSQDAIESLGKQVLNSSTINIANLFSISFKVTKNEQETQLIRNIDDAGSTGTGVILKAVLLMILLRKTLGNVKRTISIPIYIDEVGTLGSKNYEQILAVARDLNFQIFTASPKSVETADVVYPLLSGRLRGQIVFDTSVCKTKTETIVGGRVMRLLAQKLLDLQNNEKVNTSKIPKTIIPQLERWVKIGALSYNTTKRGSSYSIRNIDIFDSEVSRLYPNGLDSATQKQESRKDKVLVLKDAKGGGRITYPHLHIQLAGALELQFQEGSGTKFSEGQIFLTDPVIS